MNDPLPPTHIMNYHGGNGSRLQEEDRQFRWLVDEVEDYAIFMLNTDGYVRTWNRGAERIKGYSKDDIIGQHFSTFYPKKDAEAGLPEQLLGEAKEDGRTEHEGWRVRKDGSRFWASVSITAIHDEDDEHIGYAKVTKDLTERRHHERRLEQFAHAVSHDLRQPLRTMTVDLELLHRDVGESLDEEPLALLDDAIDGAKRMGNLVDGLLEYARVETETTAAEPVGLNGVVDDVISNLAAMIDDRDADLDVGSLPVVRGDREQLQVVFQNLIENALKYSGKDDPSVEIEGSRDDGMGRVAVSDDGIGIKPEEREAIFELFERSHEVEESQGIGLGLALTKQIVEQHDGDIWVESTPGKGSTFHLRFPLA